MNRIRSIFKPESSHSQATTQNLNIIAPLSNFNHVGGDQYNITNIHPSAYITPLAITSAAPPPSPAPFNDAPIDNLSIHFTGRRRELALIAKAFEKRRDVPLRCALYGNQGVGKSQLTYSWAKSTFSRKENVYVMWISAMTIEKLFQGFCRLLRFINHPDQSHPDQNARLEAARRWLEEVDTGNWLLVFDNVFPETVDFLRQHLPRVNSRGTILFTTRSRDVAVAVTSTAGERHEIIEVPLLSVEEAVELFSGHFDVGKVDPSSAKVEAIIKALGCLPLAISHAAAYLDQTRSSLDDLLKLYQSKYKIDVISWEHTLSDYEHKSVAATFTSQLQQLDQRCPDANNLLRVLAFLDPESIPLDMLNAGAEAILEAQQQPTLSPLAASLIALIRSPVALENAIAHLQNRCLATYHTTSQSSTIRIHDLIQLVVLENTRSSGLSEESFDLAVELTCAAFAKTVKPWLSEWWPRCEQLIPHIQSLTMRQDMSITAKKALLWANNRRALYLSTRGRYVEAKSLYEKIIVDGKQFCNHDHPDTLTVMHELAWVHWRTGRYVDAEVLFRRVLESRQTQLGPTHRSTLNTMYHLARVYHNQHRYDDAETLFQQTLQSQESQFVSEDVDTLETVTMLAHVYDSQDRYDAAELLLKRVLHAREKLFSLEDYHTLTTKHALANVYHLQRHYDTAVPLYQQVLRALERDLGPQHPNTLTAINSLAVVYTSQERFDEAETLLVRVLAGREEVYGLLHRDTQTTVKKLVLVYEKLGRGEEARMLKQCISPSS